MEVVFVDESPNIVTAAQSGDIDAFTELVRRYQDLAFVGRVRSFARRPPGPAMDPLASTSRLLRDGLIDPQHARVPGQVRALLEWSRAEQSMAIDR